MNYIRYSQKAIGLGFDYFNDAKARDLHHNQSIKAKVALSRRLTKASLGKEKCMSISQVHQIT